MVDECDDEIEYWRFDNGLTGMGGLACCRSPGERKNARADDRADAEAGQIQHSERTLHQTLRRRCLLNQMIGTFCPEKRRTH